MKFSKRWILVGVILFCGWEMTAGADLPAEVAGPIPVEELRARRSALASRVDSGVILIEARGGEYDAVERDFYYLTGLETAGARLLMVVEGGEERSVLYLPPHSPNWERWNGPRAYPCPEIENLTGIGDLRLLKDFEDGFAGVLRQTEHLFYLPTENPRPELPSPDQRWIAQLKEVHPQLKQVDRVGAFLHPLRQRKGPDEVSRLRRAISITVSSMPRGFAVATPGRGEFEVEAAIEGSFRAYGAEGPGFASIVGAGPNSCVLHYQSNTAMLKQGDLLVIDVGASWGGYTADITRTIPVSGRYSARQKEIYEVVLRAQLAGIAAARPGATIGEIHRAANSVFQEEGLSQFALHGTCHHVGLDVHDVGSTRRRLEPGMVITVEPGLYLPEEEIGIRVEDMILLTESGNEVLSVTLPKSPAAIEAMIDSLRSEKATPEKL